MLFHERQFLDSFKKKVARHLIPYLFFGIVTFVYWALIEGRFRGGVPVVPSRMSWRTFFSPVPESVIIRRMLCFGSYPVCLSRSCCSSEPLPSSNQRERSCMIGLLPRRLPRSAFSQSWSCILLVCRLIGSAFLGLLISCPSPCCSIAWLLVESFSHAMHAERGCGHFLGVNHAAPYPLTFNNTNSLNGKS